MKINRFLMCVLAISGFAGTLPSLSASLIGPGGIAAPDVFTSTAGFTVLASTGVMNINPAPGSSFNASYIEVVGTDANNMLCGVAGQCLTFAIEVSNAGPGTAERVSTANFGSFITDVGYNTDTGISGIAPVTVDRSADGDVVGFNFNTGATNINAGQNTMVLEIQTNALYYTFGNVAVQDGYAGFGTGFAPSSTPEPASMVLFGSALVGIGLIRRRSAKRS